MSLYRKPRRNDWKGALHSWELMKHYFRYGVCAYDYWNLALRENGLSRWGWRQNSLVVVDPQKHTYRLCLPFVF